MIIGTNECVSIVIKMNELASSNNRENTLRNEKDNIINDTEKTKKIVNYGIILYVTRLIG